MRSGKSYFNAGLFRRTAMRFWPLWTLYTAVWLLRLFAIINQYADLGQENGYGRPAYVLLDSLNTTGVWLVPIAVCLAALAAFSFMYNERSADFAAALPSKRECVYLTGVLAGLLPLLAGNVLVFALTLGYDAVIGTGCYESLPLWLLGVTLETVALYGVAVFCAQLTGHALIQPLLYLAANLAAPGLCTTLQYAASHFVFGYSGVPAAFLDYFSPFTGLMRSLRAQDMSFYIDGGEGYGFVSLAWPALYAALGLALIALGLLVYRRRRMESAGDVVAFAPLRPVFKLCCGIAFGIFFSELLRSILFYDAVSDSPAGAAVYTLLAAAGAFVGCFAGEMLIQKRFAVFGSRNTYVLWLCSALFCGAVAFGCELDVTGYETRVADPAEVESLSVMTGAGSFSLDPDTDADEYDLIEELHARALERRGDWGDQHESATYLQLIWQLDDGSLMYRRYSVPVDDGWAVAALEDLLNRPELIMQRVVAPARGIAPEGILSAGVLRYEGNLATGYVDFTPEEAAELYNDCVYPDLAEGRLGRVKLGRDSGDGLTLEFSFSDDYYTVVDDQRIAGRALVLDVTPEAERTVQWLTARGAMLE